MPAPQWIDHAGESTASRSPDDQVAGRRLRFAHEMHDRVVANIEIHVDFRAPAVRVRRHRVPDAARLELGESHHELAALDAAGMDVLEDRRRLAVRIARSGIRRDLGAARTSVVGCLACGGRADEDRTGAARIAPVFKGDVTFAEADVEAIERAELVLLAADRTAPGAPRLMMPISRRSRKKLVPVSL